MSYQSTFQNNSRSLVLRPAKQQKPAKRETSDLGSSVRDSIDASPSFASAATTSRDDPIYFGADFDEPRCSSDHPCCASSEAITADPLTLAVLVTTRAPEGNGKAAGDGTNRSVCGESSSGISLRTGGGSIDSNSYGRRKMVKTPKGKQQQQQQQQQQQGTRGHCLRRLSVTRADERKSPSPPRPVQNSATVSKLASPRGPAGSGNGVPRVSQSTSGKKLSSSAGNKKSSAVSSPRDSSRIPVLVRSQTPAGHPPCGASDSPPIACEMPPSTAGKRTNARDRVTTRKTPSPAAVRQPLNVEGASRVVDGGAREGRGRGRVAQSGKPSDKITDKTNWALHPSPSAGKASTPSSATSSRITVQNAAESPPGKHEDSRKDGFDSSARTLRQQKALLIHQNRMRKRRPPSSPVPPGIGPVKPRQSGSKPKIIGGPAYVEINSRRREMAESQPPIVNRSASVTKGGAMKQQKRPSDKKCNDFEDRERESGAVVPLLLLPPPPPPPLQLTPLEISSSFSMESSLESPMSTQRSQATDRSDGQWMHVHDRLPPMSLRLGAAAAAAAAGGSDLMQRWITSIARALSPSSYSDELSDTDALSNTGDIYLQAKSLLDSYGGYQALYDSAGSPPKSPANDAAKNSPEAGGGPVVRGGVGPDLATLSTVAVKDAGSQRRSTTRASTMVGRSESLNLWNRNRSSVASPRSVTDGVLSTSGLSGSAPPPPRNTHMERCNRSRVQVHGHSSPLSGSSREVTPRKPPRDRCNKAPETAATETAEEEEEEEAGEAREEEATPESNPAAFSAQLIPARFAVFSIVDVPELDEESPGQIPAFASVTANEWDTEGEEDYGVCSVYPRNFSIVVAVDSSSRQVEAKVTFVKSKYSLSLSSSTEKGLCDRRSKPCLADLMNVLPSGPNTVVVVNGEAASAAGAEGLAAETKGDSEACPAAKAGKSFAEDVCWPVGVIGGESRVKEPEIEPRKAAVKIAHLPGTIEHQVITITEFQDSEIEWNHAIRSLGGREAQSTEAGGAGPMRVRIPVLKKIVSVIPTWVVNSVVTVSPTEGAEKKTKTKTKTKKRETSRAAAAAGGGRLAAVATEESYSVIDVTFTDLDGKSFAAVQQLEQSDRKRDRKTKSSKRRRLRHHHSPRKSEKQPPPTTTMTSGAVSAADLERREAANNTAKALLQLLQSEYLKRRFEEELGKKKEVHKRHHSGTDKHGVDQGHRRRLPVISSFDELSLSAAANRTPAAVRDPLSRAASVDITGLPMDRSAARGSDNSVAASLPLGSSVTQVFSKRRSQAGGSAGGAGYSASKWSTSLYAKTIYFENQYEMDLPEKHIENKDVNNVPGATKNCVEERWITKEDFNTSLFHSDDDGIKSQ